MTGGAKGIGLGIVRAAAAEGAIPVFVDRDELAARKIHGEFPHGEMIIADLLLAQACYSVVQKTINKFGRLDALVNNAGVNDKVGLEHGSPTQYVESLGRNLLHYYNMAHYALPHLKKSRGCIINISSKTALTGQGGTSGYASAKGPGIDPRMGRRVTGLRHPSECHSSSRSDDAALSAMARHVFQSGGEAQNRSRQNSSGKTNDFS